MPDYNSHFITPEQCPICDVVLRVVLPSNWQEKHGVVGIIGCGNPWHYLVREDGEIKDISTPVRPLHRAGQNEV